MTPTKDALAAAYKARLLSSGMAWTSDPAKVTRFMASVQETLAGGNRFDRTGPAFVAACADVGLPKRVTLKALHALPDA